MAATNTLNDGSENVSDFLRRIKELDSSGDETDAKNARKLENDILEGRKQREARRAEHARSISPDKQSPAASLRSYRSPRSPDISSLASSPSEPREVSSTHVTSLGSVLTASNSTEEEATMQSSRGSKSAAINSSDNLIATRKDNSAEVAIPTRSGTLSWQQRPTSLRGPRTRPLSLVGRQSPSQLNIAQLSQSDMEDDQPSQDQIAQALGSKDPSWFRQTPERGIGSAAYRKAVQDNDSPANVVSQRRELHGLSKENSAAIQESSRDSDAPGNTDHSKALSHDNILQSGETKSMSTVSSEEMAPEKQPVSFPESVDISSERPSRPLSPTKGVGGFVQSAMMRRSDSVGKRWSVQSSAGSGRQQFSTRRGLDSPGASDLSSATDSANREQETGKGSSVLTNDVAMPAHGEPATPTKPMHQRSRSSVSLTNRDSSDVRPTSPSKRWSPVKSSWLESALNKPPDSPKPARPESMQPGWMVDLNKRRQQSAIQDNKPELQQTQVEDKNESKISLRSSVSYENPKGAINSAFQSPPIRPKPEFPSQISSNIETRKPENAMKLDSAFSGSQIPEVSRSVEMPVNTSTPETPPKKDFRSSIQIREASSPGKTGAGDLEFQNVFGKLRRTETKNYVAPDVLKSNILRGKAGLAVTGGPQKSARKDEFKESLIKQKVAMKAKAEDPSIPVKTPSTGKKDEPIPEAIAKKKALASTSGNSVSRSSTEPNMIPAINAGASSGDGSEGKMTADSVPSQTKPVKLEDNGISNPPKSKNLTSLNTKKAGSSDKLASSKLAGKFSPNLASIIAKGPPSPKPVNSNNTSDHMELISKDSIDNRFDASKETSSAGGQLQHMTKSRARGPKRRLPNTKMSAPPSTSTKPTPPKVETNKRVSQGPKPALPRSSRNVTPSKAISSVDYTATNTDTQYQTPEKLPITRTGFTNSGSNPLNHHRGAQELVSFEANSDISTPIIGTSRAIEPRSQQSEQSVTALANTSDIREPLLHSRNVRGTSDQQADDSKTQSLTITKRKAPIPQPANKNAEKTRFDADLRDTSLASRPAAGPKESSVGVEKALPLLSAQQSANFANTMADTSTFKTNHPSTNPPMTHKASTVSKPPVSRKPDLNLLNENRRHTKEDDTHAKELLENFFDERPIANSQAEFDTQAILDAGEDSGTEIRTLRRHIVELTGDGKQISRSQNEEHILFTSCMYLCTHIFGDSTGARVTEVYLWAGSGVSESAIEDAQIFARKTAKENGGKLTLLRQNRESPNFLQALGGILITRKGGHSETSRPYMLCCRSHSRHMTFDETEFALGSLCSGFPFIIAPQPDIFYLWKGEGCSAVELGSARLISMDLGPTSKVVEIEEGKESDEFLSIFPPASGDLTSTSADYWILKAKHPNYKTRLFRVSDPTASSVRSTSSSATATVNALWSYVRKSSQADVRLPGTPISHVTEINPFSQVDLEPEHIYLLDAFFELYIIVGSLTSSKPQEFARAAQFAQDYAIVAASTQDRPYVPPGTVVLGNPPSSMKAHFRQWDDTYVPTSALMAGHARGGRSQSRIISLNRAIEVIKAGS